MFPIFFNVFNVSRSSRFESMAQDFGDQAFRDCWLFPRIFPSCFFSFANHLISNVIRCDKDNSGMPMFMILAVLHLRNFSRGGIDNFLGESLTSLIRCSLASLHQLAYLRNVFQFGHSATLPPIKTTKSPSFLKIVSSISLTIHLVREF